MDYRTAAKAVKKGEVLPVYVCYGAEKFLLNEFVALLSNRLIDPEHRQLALGKYDLSESSVDTVLEDAETLPFLVPRKLIIAQEALFFTGAKDNNKVEHSLDKLLAYIQSPPDYTVIVFTVSADKLDERKKIVKLLKEQGAVIPFAPLGAEELNQWIRKQCELRSCHITPEAAQALILNSGTQLQLLSAELEKLALYVGRDGRIEEQTVENMVMRSPEQNVFVLIEETIKLRMEKAFSILHDLLKQREEPIKLVMLLARQFRIMLQIKELAQQGYTQQQSASQLGLHPYAVKVASEQAGKYSSERLGAILGQLAELDYAMKSGKIDKTLGLELFLLKLAG